MTAEQMAFEAFKESWEAATYTVRNPWERIADFYLDSKKQKD